ncbi:hypothetical protein TNCV_1944961 [Trichonephila clavipes]|nr:hypothetical protein TNCV_1944961 [Trichonephila clavipes]
MGLKDKAFDRRKNLVLSHDEFREHQSYSFRLEPQVQEYVEVRNPQTAIQLLEVLAKFD